LSHDETGLRDKVEERRWSSYVGYNFGILYFTEEKLFGQGKLAELNGTCFLKIENQAFSIKHGNLAYINICLTR